MQSAGDFAMENPTIRCFFAPYLNFMLDLGRSAVGELDPAKKENKIRKFQRVYRFYISESHLSWSNDLGMAPKRAKFVKFKQNCPFPRLNQILPRVGDLKSYYFAGLPGPR